LLASAAMVKEEIRDGRRGEGEGGLLPKKR
jgi:hypothetical protein